MHCGFGKHFTVCFSVLSHQLATRRLQGNKHWEKTNRFLCHAPCLWPQLQIQLGRCCDCSDGGRQAVYSPLHREIRVGVWGSGCLWLAGSSKMYFHMMTGSWRSDWWAGWLDVGIFIYLDPLRLVNYWQLFTYNKRQCNMYNYTYSIRMYLSLHGRQQSIQSCLMRFTLFTCFILLSDKTVSEHVKVNLVGLQSSHRSLQAWQQVFSSSAQLTRLYVTQDF